LVKKMVVAALLKKAKGIGCRRIGQNAGIDEGMRWVARPKKARRRQAAHVALESAYFHGWLEEEGHWTTAMRAIVLTGEHGRTRDLSAPMHRFPKFGGPMGRGKWVSLFGSPWSMHTPVHVSARAVLDRLEPNRSTC
jgi:hypothetical protein